MKLRLARVLHLLHRWLGIVAGLAVLAWFVSGLVMLYVPFPRLDAAERLAHQAPIPAAAVQVSPAAAVARCPGTLRKLRLASLDARPVWHLQTDAGACSVWADSGEPVGPVTPEAARQAARDFLGGGDVGPAESIERDQWTVYASYNAHRPLYRIAAADASGTVLYVSSRSGEVLVDTTRFERGWNWIGSVLHWVYFTPLRSSATSEAARWIVIGLSFPALLAAASGLWLGIARLRLARRYPRGRITPYRGWKRWHHLLGLGVGGFALSWLLSGWLSVHPFGLLEMSGPPPGAALRLTGGTLHASADLSLLQRQLARAPEAREAEWFRFGGRDYVELRSTDGKVRVDDRADIAPPFAPETLAKAVQAIEDKPVAQVDLITEADPYHYGHRSPPLLPAVRIRFADAEDTTYYMDPASGRILLRLDDANRRHRWIFNALHRLDFPPLAGHPAGRALVTALCLLGAAFAASACAIGWRRLSGRPPAPPT